LTGGAVTVTIFESISLPKKCTKHILSTGRLTEDSGVNEHENHFPTLSRNCDFGRKSKKTWMKV
jgi:hypothetical protein